MATSVNIDRVHHADHGDLSVPAQSAGFVVDPMLAPINAHSTDVIKPDPSPSSDPDLFDASTHQPKLHYHPEKKLGKKKKAKKLGTGAQHPQGPVHLSSNVKGDLFTAHEQDAEHRQQVMQQVQARKEHQAQHLAEELQASGSEYETDEDDTDNTAPHSHAEESTQSKQHHASERTTGQEADKAKGTSHVSTSTSTAGDNTGSKGDQKDRKNSSSSSSEENPSLLARASGAATDLANKVMQTSVVSSAAGMVNTVLSKVGLKKSNEGDQHADDEHEKDKGNEGSQTTKEVGQSYDESATKDGKKVPKPYKTTSVPANTDKQQSDETAPAK